MDGISIILCHHMGNLIDKAVSSIFLSRNVNFEIIIATSDLECEKKYHKMTPEIRAFYCQGGPAYKRNLAFLYAQYPYVAFFDDDVEVCEYTLEEMLKVLKQDSVGMVFGKLLNMEFRNRFDEAGSYLTWTGFLWARSQSGDEDKGQFENVEPILAGKSASCMIDRKVFVDAGMFDASYEILGEETDLSWRVWLLGYKVLFVPKSITYHAFNTRFKPGNFYVPKRVYYNGCRNYISMLLTNLEARNLQITLMVQVSVWLAASMGMLITGKFEAGKYILQGLIYVATHLSSILSKRKRVQKSRKIGDRQLFPLIKKSPPAEYYIKRLLHYIKTGRHG